MEANDVFTLSFGGTTVYAAAKDQWAYFADTLSSLNDAPTDPRVFLDDLPKRYDLALRLSLQRLPQDFRDEFVPRFKESLESLSLGTEQIEGESEELYAAQLQLWDYIFRQFHRVVNDLDEVLLGWNLDVKTKSTHLDLEVTAKSGTKLAEWLTQFQGGKSDFASLLSPNAALNAGVLGPLTDAQVKAVTGALADLRQWAANGWAKAGLSEDERQAATQFLDKLVDLLGKTARNKKLEAALSLSLDSRKATLVAGAKVAGAATLEQSLRQLAADAPKEAPAAGRFTVRAEPYKGINLYAISLPAPDEGLVTLVGKRLDIVVGIDGEKLLVAAGRDALPRCKEALDQVRSGPGKEMLPLQLRLAVPPIASLVASLSKNKHVKAGATLLAGFGISAGRDNHVSFTVTPIAGGVRARVQLEGGLVKMLCLLNQLTGLVKINGL